MAKTARHIPPSRVRYEDSHPTVSCRVSREFYDSLIKVKTQEGKSFSDILKLGLVKIENTNKKLKEASKNSFDEGYQKGYDEAEGTYKVTYHCSKCKQIMAVDSQKEKQAIDDYLSATWHHTECPRPKINRIP